MRELVVFALLMCLCGGTAWAQEEPPPLTPPAGQPYTYSAGPVSLTVAMAGVVVTTAGFALMLHTTAPCYCEPRTAWVVGGFGVVVAGVTMVWLGLRDRKVTVLPLVTKTSGGALAVIRWGGAKGELTTRATPASVSGEEAPWLTTSPYR